MRTDATLFDIDLQHDSMTTGHPGLKTAIDLFPVFWDNLCNGDSPSEIVTSAMEQELRETGGFRLDRLVSQKEKDAGIRTPLQLSEHRRDYPETAKLARVIASDTKVVIVDETLKRRVREHDRIDPRELLGGSVQLWSAKIADLGLEPVYPEADLYFWNDAYDPLLLGIMAGLLKLIDGKQMGYFLVSP